MLEDSQLRIFITSENKKIVIQYIILYCFSNKMSDQQVISILKKYQNLGSSSSAQLLSLNRYDGTGKKTEKKRDSSNFDQITFMNMDEDSTPSKDFRQNDRFLRKLDETQQKLALSERNYVELWRKYQLLKVQALDLQNKFLKEEKMNDQQLKALKLKLARLESENKLLMGRVNQRDNLIDILQNKINQKNEQIIRLQQQNHRKIAISHNRKSDIENTLTPREILRFKEQSNKSMESLINNYQQQISDLAMQLKKFDSMLLQKQKQKKQLSSLLQEQNNRNRCEISELKDFLKSRDQQLQKMAEKYYQQKQQLINSYEDIIRQTKRQVFTAKQQSIAKEGSEMKKMKDIIKHFENQILQIKDQNKKLCFQSQKHQIYVLESQRKNQYMKTKVKQVQEQLSKQKQKNIQLSAIYQQLSRKFSQQGKQGTQIIVQFNELKIKCERIFQDNERIGKQNSLFREQISKMKTIIKNLEGQNQKARDNQLNINSKLSKNSVKMKQKIVKLQAELEDTIQQLYAERLEKARAVQQLQQTKTQLRRKYQLSLENIEKEHKLKQQSSNAKFDSDYYKYDKQALYLKLKQLERKYEMLTSQVVSVQDLLGVATKIHKLYKGCA